MAINHKKTLPLKSVFRIIISFLLTLAIAFEPVVPISAYAKVSEPSKESPCQYTLEMTPVCRTIRQDEFPVFVTLKSIGDDPKCSKVAGRLNAFPPLDEDFSSPGFAIKDPVVEGPAANETYQFIAKDKYPTTQLNRFYKEGEVGVRLILDDGRVFERRANVTVVDPTEKFEYGRIEFMDGLSRVGRTGYVKCIAQERCYWLGKPVGLALLRIEGTGGRIELEKNGCVYHLQRSGVIDLPPPHNIRETPYKKILDQSIRSSSLTPKYRSPCKDLTAKVVCDRQPGPDTGTYYTVGQKYEICPQYCPLPSIREYPYITVKRQWCPQYCPQYPPIRLCQIYPPIVPPKTAIEPFCCQVSGVCRCCVQTVEFSRNVQEYIKEAWRDLQKREEESRAAVEKQQKELQEKMVKWCKEKKDGEEINPAELGLDPEKLLRSMGYSETEAKILAAMGKVKLKVVTIKGVKGYIVSVPGDIRYEAGVRVVNTPSNRRPSLQDQALAKDLKFLFWSCDGKYEWKTGWTNDEGYWIQIIEPKSPGEPRRFVKRYTGKDPRIREERGIVTPDGRYIVEKSVFKDGTEIEYKREGDTIVSRVWKGQDLGWNISTGPMWAGTKVVRDVYWLEHFIEELDKSHESNKRYIEKLKRGEGYPEGFNQAQKDAFLKHFEKQIEEYPKKKEELKKQLEQKKKELEAAEKNNEIRKKAESLARSTIQGTNVKDQFKTPEEKEKAIQSLTKLLEDMLYENPQMESLNIDVKPDGTILIKPNFPKSVTNPATGITTTTTPTYPYGEPGKLPAPVIAVRFTDPNKPTEPLKTEKGPYKGQNAMVVYYEGEDPSGAKLPMRWREYIQDSDIVLERQTYVDFKPENKRDRDGTNEHRKYIIPYKRTGPGDYKAEEDKIELDAQYDEPVKFSRLLPGQRPAHEVISEYVPGIPLIQAAGEKVGESLVWAASGIGSQLTSGELSEKLELNKAIQLCKFGNNYEHEDIVACLRRIYGEEMVKLYEKDLAQFTEQFKEEVIRRMLANSGNVLTTDCLDAYRQAMVTEELRELHAKSLGHASVIIREGSTTAFWVGTAMNVVGKFGEMAPLMFAMGFVGHGYLLADLMHSYFAFMMATGIVDNTDRFINMLREGERLKPEEKSEIIAAVITDASMIGWMSWQQSRAGKKPPTQSELEQARQTQQSKITELDKFIKEANDRLNKMNEGRKPGEESPAAKQLKEAIDAMQGTRNLMEAGLTNLEGQINAARKLEAAKEDPAKLKQELEELAKQERELRQKIEEFDKKPAAEKTPEAQKKLLDDLRRLATERGILEGELNNLTGEGVKKVEDPRFKEAEKILEESKKAVEEGSREALEKSQEALTEQLRKMDETLRKAESEMQKIGQEMAQRSGVERAELFRRWSEQVQRSVQIQNQMNRVRSQISVLDGQRRIQAAQTEADAINRRVIEIAEKSKTASPEEIARLKRELEALQRQCRDIPPRYQVRVERVPLRTLRENILRSIAEAFGELSQGMGPLGFFLRMLRQTLFLRMMEEGMLREGREAPPKAPGEVPGPGRGVQRRTSVEEGIARLEEIKQKISKERDRKKLEELNREKLNLEERLNQDYGKLLAEYNEKVKQLNEIEEKYRKMQKEKPPKSGIAEEFRREAGPLQREIEALGQQMLNLERALGKPPSATKPSPAPGEVPGPGRGVQPPITLEQAQTRLAELSRVAGENQAKFKELQEKRANKTISEEEYHRQRGELDKQSRELDSEMLGLRNVIEAEIAKLKEEANKIEETINKINEKYANLPATPEIRQQFKDERAPFLEQLTELNRKINDLRSTIQKPSAMGPSGPAPGEVPGPGRGVQPAEVMLESKVIPGQCPPKSHTPDPLSQAKIDLANQQGMVDYLRKMKQEVSAELLEMVRQQQALVERLERLEAEKKSREAKPSQSVPGTPTPGAGPGLKPVGEPGKKNAIQEQGQKLTKDIKTEEDALKYNEIIEGLGDELLAKSKEAMQKLDKLESEQGIKKKTMSPDEAIENGLRPEEYLKEYEQPYRENPQQYSKTKGQSPSEGVKAIKEKVEEAIEKNENGKAVVVIDGRPGVGKSSLDLQSQFPGRKVKVINGDAVVQAGKSPAQEIQNALKDYDVVIYEGTESYKPIEDAKVKIDVKVFMEASEEARRAAIIRRGDRPFDTVKEQLSPERDAKNFYNVDPLRDQANVVIDNTQTLKDGLKKEQPPVSTPK